MSLPSSTRRSSTKATAVNPLQSLQTENETLRQEIASLQKIFSMPIDENHRYQFFRYQIYSLEKQIALLTRLLDAKREAVATCETILLELSQFLQDFKTKLHRKETIEENSVQMWIDRIESNRKKSFKSMQDHASLADTDTLYAPHSSKYLQKESVHLLDVCSGKIEHLNLKNLAILESSLYDLHADLRSFQSELRDQTNHLIFPHLHTNLVQRSNELSNRIHRTSNELFFLSILVPTRHQRCSFSSDQINSDLICQRISSQFRLSPNIKIFLQSIFDALIASFNHQINLLNLELKIKNKQLSFYRHSLTKIQCQFIQNFLEILSQGQKAFNQQLQKNLYEPLVNIIKEFNRMNEEKSDQSLKSFLFTFKIHLDPLNESLRDLYEQMTEGSQAIEQVFLDTNDQMWKEIEKQQKQMVDEINGIKQGNENENSKSLEKLFQLLELTET